MTEIGNEAARHVATTNNVSLPLTVVVGARFRRLEPERMRRK